jgi:cell wall assembly regulator SMI1
MPLTPGDVARVGAAWKRIDELLRARDPRLLATLRPKVAARAELRWTQPEPLAWFKAHDGQKPTARAFHDGYRLLSFAENQRRWKRQRGDSYRPDWDDSWTVIGVRGAGQLLCSYNGVYAVDVARKDGYKKTRVARSLAEWLEGAEAALAGAGDAAAKATKAASAGTRVAPPPANADLARSFAAIAAWIAANPDEGYALGKPATAAAVRAAERAFGRPLPPRVRALAGITDGQPWRSSGIFGGYGLLSVADAAKEYASELKVREKVGDAGYWKDTWWPFANNGAGDSFAVDAATGAVVEASNDPYRRKRAGTTLDRWVAKRAREVCGGKWI